LANLTITQVLPIGDVRKRIAIFDKAKLKKSVKSLAELVSNGIQWDQQKFLSQLLNHYVISVNANTFDEKNSNTFSYTIYEKENEILVVFDLPGFTQDELNIVFPNDKSIQISRKIHSTTYEEKAVMNGWDFVKRDLSFIIYKKRPSILPPYLTMSLTVKTRSLYNVELISAQLRGTGWCSIGKKLLYVCSHVFTSSLLDSPFRKSTEDP